MRTFSKEELKTVSRVVDDMRCVFDPLNPCWSNRSSDVPGKHWDGSEACAVCSAKSVLASGGIWSQT